MAKHKLKEWFDSAKIEPCLYTSNRKSGVYINYPICKIKLDCVNEDYPHEVEEHEINSWEKLWDEIEIFEEIKKFQQESSPYWFPSKDNQYNWVPTYEECISKYNLYPIAFISLVCENKGTPRHAIEVYYKNLTNLNKITKLQEFGMKELIEVDAEWILEQTTIPRTLKYNRLIQNNQIVISNNMIETRKHSYNKLKNLKYFPGIDFSGNCNEFINNCENYLNNLISNFNKNIYIESELNKNIYEECYYDKYLTTIKAIQTYGNNFTFLYHGWGGWGGDKYIVDGCIKKIMYKFIKHYSLINPMMILKKLKELYGNKN